jgi:hypothetical protein
MALNISLFHLKKKRKQFSRSVEDIITSFKKLPYKSSSFLYLITIRIVQNNIFCYIGNIATGKTILKLSSGLVKLNITKKTIKFHSSRIVPYFFSLLPSRIINCTIGINFIVPQVLKRKIFFLVLSKLKKSRGKKMFLKLFFFSGKKCFNGCRVAKLKRKKRHKFRIYK